MWKQTTEKNNSDLIPKYATTLFKVNNTPEVQKHKTSFTKTHVGPGSLPLNQQHYHKLLSIKSIHLRMQGEASSEIHSSVYLKFYILGGYIAT